MNIIKKNSLKTIIILWLVIVLSFNVHCQIPVNYYDGTDGLEQEALKAVLNDIIKGHTIYTYTSTLTDTWDILKESDADPNNSSNVILVYSGRSVDGAQEYNNGSGWTREHTWPNSRGDFGTVRGPGTDLHNLKPCDVSVNSARSNRWLDYADEYYYDDGVNTGSKTSYTDFVWEPRDEVKGDVARIIFYMATRYEGEDGEIDLEVVDYFPADDSYEPLMALLQTLKEWNEMDPVDDFERNRNDVIYSYQNNRNPFIDHPEFVEKIWGPVISESQGLFISEYIEGDSYDKAIEIYNNSESTIDLSNVKLQKDNGGDQSFSYSLSLSGTINPHDVFVIAHNSASAEIRAKANLTTTSLVMTFNGDDQLRILNNGVEADHIGDVGNYGENRTFVRAGHVLKGDTSAVNPQLSLDWIELNNGNYSCLGYHYTNQTLTTPQLFISEYIEGSSYNKGIEIFNASSEVIDLSNLALLKQTNGLEGFSGFSLSGELNPYSVYCIVHPSATAALLEKAEIQTVGGVMDFNGNDPIMLVYKGVAIDKIGNSGGSNFAIDKGLLRNSSQALPSKEWNVLEWTNIAKDDFSYFGEHQYLYSILSINIQVVGNNLTAIPDGGAGTYSYLWSTGETTATITTDGTGIYSVKVTDGLGEQFLATHDFANATNHFDHNFVKSETALVGDIKFETELNTLTVDGKSTVFSYLDGLGRAIQTVAVQASPMKNDIVQHIEYDELGRQVREYKPYAVASEYGAFHEEASTEQRNFHFVFPEIANSAYPYAEKVFDNSPLNRVMELGAPGADWQPENASIANSGHTVKMNYLTNITSDGVIMWSVDNSGNCVNEGSYPEHTLYKNETVDENGHSVLEFTDLTGKTILKKTNDGTNDLLTYYVYDDFNRLRYVFPPKSISLLGTTITPTSLSELIYYYEFDQKGRMTKKKIPGADPVLMVYDRRDRLVLSQDGNLAAQGKWNFTKYDILNRPILSGVVRLTGITYSQLETAFASHTVYCENISTTETYKYTLNLSYPSIAAIAETDLLTVNYYDNYNSLSAYGYSFSLPAGFDAVTRENNPINQLTGSIVWNLDKSEYYVTVKYYDEYNRLIQSISENHLNGLDRATMQYDFTGKITQSKLSHTVDASLDPNEKTIWEFYEYDHAGRITNYYHQYGNNTADKILMTAYTYNENGEQIAKKIHSEDAGSNYLQEVNYAYNIRGWLTKINDADLSDNDDLFGMELVYNNPVTEIDATIKENYNGNITGMFWNTNGTFKEKRGYGFEYDDINRLTNSAYGSETDWSNGLYDVQGITYDLNGNIMSLSRNAGITHGEIDNLAYVYNGNKLNAVGDFGIGTKSLGFKDGTSGNTSTEYQYDANGNMTRDLNKFLEIEYNLLNLPSRVSDYSYQHWLTNKYDAAGNKLNSLESNLNAISQTTDTHGRYYEGNFIYNYSLTWEEGGAVPAALPGSVGDPPPYVAVTEWDLAYVLTPEGRITFGDAGEVNYEYFLKDHLGNNRVVFADYNSDGTAELIQEDSYYPFGMQMVGLSERISGLQPNQYLYNGKELHEEMGLNWYDYGLRQYDPVLARFISIDPIANDFSHLSPFNYANNSPIVNIDLWGLQAWDINNEWNDDYIQLYNQQLLNNLSSLESQGLEFTCEDLALELLINFAKDNQLPFKWETGFQYFDASSEEYNDFEAFKLDVQERTGARDFARDANTSSREYQNINVGDISLLTAEGRNNPNHVQVVTALYFDDGVLKGFNAAQGNFNWLGRLGSNNPESLLYMGVTIQHGYYSKDLDYWHNFSERKITYEFLKSHYNEQYRTYNFTNWNEK